MGTRFLLQIKTEGAESFGWEISTDESTVLHRSTRLFATRIEALFDAARAVASLPAAEEEEPSECRS